MNDRDKVVKMLKVSSKRDRDLFEDLIVQYDINQIYTPSQSRLINKKWKTYKDLNWVKPEQTPPMVNTLEQLGWQNIDNQALKNQLELLGVATLVEAVNKVKRMPELERQEWLRLAQEIAEIKEPMLS